MTKYGTKILTVVLLLLAITVQAKTPEKVKNKKKIVFSDPLKTIVVKKSNPIVRITLPANPTTGYSWSLKSYDNNIVVPVTRKFFPPSSKKLTGAPGYEVWTFRVNLKGFVVPQITSINLIYLRPWDEQGAQVLSFKIVTSNDN